MKHRNFSPDQPPKQADASRPAPANLNPKEIDFAPSPDAVARKAYFCYVNEGSLPGRDVQHWLTAEAELLAERKLTRTHGFHNPT